MSTIAFLLLCVQACLIQSVLSQCAGRISTEYGKGLPSSSGVSSLGLGSVLSATGYGTGLGGAGLTAGLTGGCGNPGSSYGGIGNGEVVVLGELPVRGATAVSGDLPVIGLVQFRGPVAASGRVSISGNCGCGCDGY